MESHDQGNLVLDIDDNAAMSENMNTSEALKDSLAEAEANMRVMTLDEAMNEMLEAIAAGNIGTMTTMLTGVSVEQPFDDGDSFMHKAVQYRNADPVALLLQAGAANIDVRDAEGLTPLMRAVRCDNEEIVELLLANHANLEACDAVGNTSLHHSVVAPTEMTELLLHHGADGTAVNNAGETPLLVACTKYGVPDKDDIVVCTPPKLATLSALVADGSDVNARAANGNTALHKLVYEIGRAPFDRDYMGNRATKFLVKCIMLLINSRAHMDIPGENGLTFLDMIENGKFDYHKLVKIFVRRKFLPRRCLCLAAEKLVQLLSLSAGPRDKVEVPGHIVNDLRLHMPIELEMSVASSDELDNSADSPNSSN